MAPTQAAMDAWITHSPFRAVGIYISGDSRACRTQPNLSPTWVSTQVARGWRLLPIALGPQASCLDRFPRYKDDFTGGEVQVEVDEGGRGVRLARLSFPVRIERDVEARTLAEAVQFFLHDDRVPDLVHLHDINVVPVHEMTAPQLAQAAE